jgi:hypothetical protein
VFNSPCCDSITGNTSSIHPLDYKTLPEIVDYSLRVKADGLPVVKTHADSRDAMLNQHINTQRLEGQGKHSLRRASTSTAAATVGRGDVPILFPNPTTLAYLLGQDILVHPITLDIDNRTASAVVHITFPELASVIPASDAAPGTEWLDWWEPTNAAKAHKAGETKTSIVSIESFPVYVRKGAFIPLHPMTHAPTAAELADPTLDASSHAQMDRVHFTWFAPSAGTVQYALRESVSEGTGMVASASLSGDTITATVSAHTGALGAGFDFVGVTEPADVQLTYWPNSRCTHSYAERTKTLSVSCAQVAGGLKVTITGVAATL